MPAHRRPLPIIESIQTAENWAHSPDSQDVACLLKVAASGGANDSTLCSENENPGPITQGHVKSKARSWGKESDCVVSGREFSKLLSDAMVATDDVDRWSLLVRLRLVEASLVQDILDSIST